jgi:hypothetical protein
MPAYAAPSPQKYAEYPQKSIEHHTHYGVRNVTMQTLEQKREIAEERASKDREYKLERVKVLVSILTPAVLALLTYVVNNAIQERGAALKREAQILGEKQKIYAELGAKLNIIFVYVEDVGDFSSYTPDTVVKIKREVDRQFHTYLPYWSKATEDRYNDYMGAAFATYNGTGLPAKISGSKLEKVAAFDRVNLKWDSAWDGYFTGERDAQTIHKYYNLVGSLLQDTVNAEIRNPLALSSYR